MVHPLVVPIVENIDIISSNLVGMSSPVPNVINARNCCVSSFHEASEDIIMGADNNVTLMAVDGVSFVVVELGHKGFDHESCLENMHMVNLGLCDANKAVDVGLDLSPIAYPIVVEKVPLDTSCGVDVISSREASLGPILSPNILVVNESLSLIDIPISLKSNDVLKAQQELKMKESCVAQCDWLDEFVSSPCSGDREDFVGYEVEFQARQNEWISTDFIWGVKINVAVIRVSLYYLCDLEFTQASVGSIRKREDTTTVGLYRVQHMVTYNRRRVRSRELEEVPRQGGGAKETPKGQKGPQRGKMDLYEKDKKKSMLIKLQSTLKVSKQFDMGAILRISFDLGYGCFHLAPLGWTNLGTS
ncbi:hypothetical protein M5K25_020053 [Dendrobium thyrsiflorum]|uniref:Uncharacterized protein n=1 Tax=Dendrobium thyrsiflorum TaxID=117978 RepID=A0ABD0UFQ1_DENTH